MPQFDVSTFSSQVFWLLFVFSILFLFFSKYYVPKMSSVFFKRGLQLKGIEHEIRYLLMETEKLKQDYEDRISEATLLQTTQIAELRSNLQNTLLTLEKKSYEELGVLSQSMKEDIFIQQKKLFETLPETISGSISAFLNEISCTDSFDKEQIQKKLEQICLKEVSNES